jgi:hypothetical protein
MGISDPRPALRMLRTDPERDQRVWVIFGGIVDQPWLRLLKPGFRHCFAAIHDERGWTVVEPLSRRTLVQHLPVEPARDLPTIYRRAGLTVLGPYWPGEPEPSWAPPLTPNTCVTQIRALLGPWAPFAITPFGLWKRLAPLPTAPLPEALLTGQEPAAAAHA